MTQTESAYGLEEGEDCFRALFEQARYPALLMAGGRFVAANHASLETMRVQRLEDFLQLTPADTSPPCQPDGRPSAEKAAEMIRLARAQGGHEFEWEHLRADGEHFTASILLTPIRHRGQNLLYVLWRDISVQKKTERELAAARERTIRHEQQQRLSDLLEQDIVGVAQTDAKGCYTLVNDRYCAILGRTRHSLLGRMTTDVKRQENRAFAEQLQRRVLQEKRHFVVEQRVLRVDGEPYWLQLAVTVHRDANGNVDSHMLLALDITERKQQELQILLLNAELEAKVEARTTELLAANEELRQLARHDALTGLPNRLAANERRHLEFVALQRSAKPYAVLLIDIDHFKQVNDSFGHAVGDRVLRQMGRTLAQSLRESDFVARWGGEEFLVLLPDTGLDAGTLVAEKLRQAIESCPDSDAGLITISLGLALATPTTPDEDTPLREADACLYAAKREGRNRLVAASPA